MSLFCTMKDSCFVEFITSYLSIVTTYGFPLFKLKFPCIMTLSQGGEGVKVRIEVDENNEEEIVIRCQSLTPHIMKLQQMLVEDGNRSGQLVLYKGDVEYYINLSEILFFETENSLVIAHTAKDAYETRKKLYELENLLPGAFLRISKSAIVNTDKIYAINRNLTASSAIEFQGTHKQIYVSRAYYKLLKEKMEEKR